MTETTTGVEACRSSLGIETSRSVFAQFLSSESRSLMGIKDPAEFKLYAVDRFRGIVYAAVKTSRKTNSPIPTWAEAKVIEAWNVSTPRTETVSGGRKPNSRSADKQGKNS